LSPIKRKLKLAHYNYALERMIDFASAWVINSADTKFKILLGQKIGLDAIYVAQISTRLSEMLCEAFTICPSRDYERNFDQNTHLSNTQDIASFFTALIKDMLTDLEDYLDSGKNIEDEPTLIILTHLRSILHHQVTSFQTLQIKPLTLVSIKLADDQIAQPYDSMGAIPIIANIPGRPPNMHYSDKPDVDDKTFQETARSLESLRKFLHFIYLGVEIPTMEVCARMMLDHRDMPLAFKLDLARQIWDEARHAAFMRRRMEELGCFEGEYAYSYPSWTSYMMGDDIAEQLAMLQVVTEGNGLDAGIFLASELRNNGDYETAEIFEYQNMDETTHAGLGNKWLLNLLNGSYEAYVSLVLSASEKIGRKIPGPAPLDIKARLFAGYPARFIESLIGRSEHLNL
jgi:uncharacterized ferritin-like protein (DUF455 family)